MIETTEYTADAPSESPSTMAISTRRRVRPVCPVPVVEARPSRPVGPAPVGAGSCSSLSLMRPIVRDDDRTTTRVVLVNSG